ncbi:MAG: methyltransferase domain-containing protein [Verrucomicrobia bacterium]|nr:methyltransferase domain-containing protein [Verrucomicrobiota bacterium]MBV9671652.1 methyltransferase domain-containing protein [Verrucomicrobiota bacterium]
MLQTIACDSPGKSAVNNPASGCRFCRRELTTTFVDLGMSPLCESYLQASELNNMEPFYPLHVQVCEACYLVQLPQYVSPEHIFSEYAYFSSYSDSWLQHSQCYVEMITRRLGLGPDTLAVELASNDGYLLQYFVKKQIPVLGVEPAINVAKVAVEKGIPTLVRFFGRESAREMLENGQNADLVIGNNVLAQVPDLNDFVAGIRIVLKPSGVATLEFPHLIRLMEENQYDTIYHEHFSYFSFLTVERIFSAHGLTLFDVEEIPTHGGSIRIYARRKENHAHPVMSSVVEMRERELSAGLDKMETYANFAEQVKESKRALLDLLIGLKRQRKIVAGYGAPGKGNTLLNYCGIRTDFVDFTVDRNPYKQGRFLPGTHIPIYPVEHISERKPDFILILPWNLKQEILAQLSYARAWGAKFIVPIPSAEIVV